MNDKRDKGQADNPWVRRTEPAEEEKAPEEELPPSPWTLEVPPRPSPWSDPGSSSSEPSDDWDRRKSGADRQRSSSPWGDAGSAGQADPGAGGWGAGRTGSSDRTRSRDRSSERPPGGTESSGATETGPAWGDKVDPPSLRRPVPVKKRGPVPPWLIPVAAGLAVVVLVAAVLVVLTGGDDEAQPAPSPSAAYTPPANAIAVGNGVSVVPVPGWSLLTKEKQGRQLVNYAANGSPRAFLWVRQKPNVPARTFLLGIVEGETEGEVTQLGDVRNLPCPRDVLVECVAISYTSSPKEGPVKGYVEAYRHRDGVVTALDFRTRADYAATAEAAAAPMRKSVLDSL